MSEIDLRQGNKTFRVSTSVNREGIAYMGPDVIVTARDETHAKEQVKQAGHTPNPHFPPERIDDGD